MVCDAAELLDLISSSEVPYDLFVVDLDDRLVAVEVAEVVGNAVSPLPTSVWVFGPASEVTHDLIDDVLLARDDRSQVETVTAWVSRPDELTVERIARSIQYMSPTGHAVVWAPDPVLRGAIEAALERDDEPDDSVMLTAEEPGTHRSVVVEDDGCAVFAYLLHEQQIVGHVWSSGDGSRAPRRRSRRISRHRKSWPRSMGASGIWATWPGRSGLGRRRRTCS